MRWYKRTSTGVCCISICLRHTTMTHISGTYGKTKVRVVRVRRPLVASPTYNELAEVHVEVLLEGDFIQAYTEGDNSKVIPTDTIKNTCYVIAKESFFDSIEDYGLSLIRYFLNRHSHVSTVRVSLKEHIWERIAVNGTPHEHAFKSCGPEVYTAECSCQRDERPQVVSGIKELKVMKTTQSGFDGYLRDEYTTLQPSKDRIFCTTIQGSWRYLPSVHEKQFHRINDR
eukprot:GHVQ01007993.1.p1 GENE.GHVQ01007993.1~~GHVQ01007993.1.p1  ORF type:complete len:228 (+),score=20.83 GHVQ01007993.1:118-801(+)